MASCAACQTKFVASCSNDTLIATLKQGSGIGEFENESELHDALSQLINFGLEWDEVNRFLEADRFHAARVNELPHIAGYEVLEVLGRGGMGVVYKAKQKGLNRIVALKMILSGSHASQIEVSRFRAEAEAIARLHHPHIVQIYEIGLADGYPYFSLEFLDGGSLASALGGVPQSPVESAKLIQALAEAMQFAHDNGVVHRDLKPANILLVKPRRATALQEKKVSSPSNFRSSHSSSHFGEPTCILGSPKIADFGLAKQLNSELDRTASGSILGSPNYMAPEQARGNLRDIGPASDIYSLGAILYEMLTGRPPFRAACVIETLDQVRSQDPLPPRQLLSSITADLETICLKCLQKDPQQRYARAMDLADDLRRFLAGEPILARPVNAIASPYRWITRNREVAGLMAFLGLLAIATLSYPSLFNASAEPSKSTVSTTEIEWHDALKMTPPPANWQMTSDGLFQPTIAANQVVQIPFDIRSSYQLQSAFTRLSGERSVNYYFPVGDHVGVLYLDIEDSNSLVVDGKLSGDSPVVRKNFPLESGHRYSLTIDVRVTDQSASIEIALDGQPHLSWSGPLSRLPSSHPSGRFSLGSRDGDTIYHELKIAELVSR